MARIQGVEIPNQKRVEVGLTYIYGIGRSTSNKILKQAEIDLDKRVKDLSVEDINKIKSTIEDLALKIEGDVRTEVRLNIKRIMELGTYKGKRHRVGLPVNGQRTRTNARTRKGPKKTVANKKKVTK